MDSENPVDVPVRNLQADFIGENPLKVKADKGGYIVKLDSNPLVNDEYEEVLSQIRNLSGKEEILILLKEEILDMPDGMPQELRQKLSQIKMYKGNVKGTEVPVELKVIQLPSITRYKMTLYSSASDKEYVIESYELDEREIPKEASKMRKNAMSHIKKGKASYRSSRLKEGQNNAVFHFEASQGSISSSQVGCGSSDLPSALSSTEPAPSISARRAVEHCNLRGYHQVPINLWINKDYINLRGRDDAFVRNYMQTLALEKTATLHKFFRNTGNYLAYGIDEFIVLPIVFSGYEVDSEIFWQLHDIEKVSNIGDQTIAVNGIMPVTKIQSNRLLNYRINAVVFEDDWGSMYHGSSGNGSVENCGGEIANEPFLVDKSSHMFAHELGHSLGLRHSDGRLLFASTYETIMVSPYSPGRKNADYYSDHSGKKMRINIAHGDFKVVEFPPGHSFAPEPPPEEPCRNFSMSLYYRYFNTRDPITSCHELKRVLSRFKVELRDQVTLCSYSEEGICERFGLTDDPFDWFEGSVEIYKNEYNQVVVEYNARFTPQSGFPDDIDQYYVDGIATWSSPRNQGRVHALFQEAQPPGARDFFTREITIDDPGIRLHWSIIASVQFRYRRNGIWHTREFGRKSVILGNN